jgi:hypothetical protein
MSLKTRLPALLCLASALGLAETWTGFLVNSRCYESLESNHNPNDTETYVNRDRGAEVRYCAPNVKTKSFAVVGQDGQTVKFDASGNVKAAELVRQTGKKTFWPVKVTGQLQQGKVIVDSISPATNSGKR